jgi:hypothetical protein
MQGKRGTGRDADRRLNAIVRQGTDQQIPTDGITSSTDALKLALDQLWDHVLNVATRFRVNVRSVTDEMRRRQ